MKVIIISLNYDVYKNKYTLNPTVISLKNNLIYLNFNHAVLENEITLCYE